MELHLYDEDEAPDVITVGAPEQAVTSVLDSVTAERDEATPVDDRRGYLGGSDAAAIAGLSPWKTPYQLYLEKTGQVQSPDLSSNERVYWGTVLEEVVAREYAQRTGNKVRRVNKLLLHDEYPFIGAHIDRDILNTDGLLEVKTTGRRDDWGEPGTDQVPDHYYAQVQHYMMVTGSAWADVAVLFFGQEMQVYHVPRDNEFIAGLLKMELAFWQHVTDREPPAPETSEEANQAWPRGEGTVKGNEGTLLTAKHLYEVKEQIKELKAEQDRLEAELKRQMQDIGDTLTYNGAKLATWKVQTAWRFDSKTFAADHPDLYDEYKRESESRVFRLSYKPGKE